MKEKTLQKLQKRFQALPLHFIDTDIFFEANCNTKLGDQCSAYLNKVGYNYRGVIPLSVMGEYFLITFRDKTQEGRYLLFNFLDILVEKRKIKFSVLKYDSIKIVGKIKELDSRIEDTDAIHLANCIQDNGNTFVTFDEKLAENKRIENEFGIKIMHPEDL